MIDDTSTTPAKSPGRPANAVKGVASYTVAGLLGKGIGFLMLPLYTQVLTPADYGRLTVVTSIGAMTSIILMFGLDSPLIRIYFEFDGKPQRQREFIQSVWRFVTVASLGGCLTVGLVAIAVLGLSTDGTLNGPDVLLGMIATGLGVVGTSVSLPALRAGERFRGYLTVMATSALAAAGSAAILVLVLRTGVLGALTAGIIANVIVLAVAVRVLPWQRNVRTDRALIRRSLRMGIPLIPHFASMQALVLADRLILVDLVSASALGLYGLASNVALPAMIACQAITTATMPTYARVGTGQDDSGRETLKRMVTMQVAAIAFVTTAMALLGSPLIGILASESFADAAPLVGWIVLGFGFLGLYGIPMNGATIGAGRTNRAWIATIIGAASNIILILVLTPRIGIEGAAIASAGGYLVLLMGIALWAHAGPNPVSYDLRRVSAAIVFGVVAFAAGTMPDFSSDIESLAFRSSVILALGLSLAAMLGMAGRITAMRSSRRALAPDATDPPENLERRL